MKPGRTILIVIIFLITSCSGFVINNHITGNYFLCAPDIDEDLSLCYHEPDDESNYLEIIGSTVFAVGYNDDYIIAKQHPRIFPNRPNGRITNYYILPLTNRYNWKLIGPLTIKEFNLERLKLNIPQSLNFTIEYKR